MPESITRPGIIKLLESGDVQIIDVLPEQEYSEAHLPGAVNIWLKLIGPDTVSGLNTGTPTVVY